MERPYHPALARMAAQYDDVLAQLRAGMLSDAEARRKVTMLAARDDSGVEWTIDPDTGSWRYRNSSGGFSYASPPSLGSLPDLPSDVGSSGFRPGSDRALMFEVPDELAPRALGGSAPSDRASRPYALLAALLVAAAVLAMIL